MNAAKGNQPSGIILKKMIGLTCGKENTTMKNSRKGFSLFETLLGICGLVMLSFLSNAYMMNFMRTNSSIKEVSQATAIGNTVMESMRMKSYDAIKVGDSTFTVNNKYTCVSKVIPNAGSKTINLFVQWNGNGKPHKIEVSTIRAQ
jgi:hypothetical protein